MSEFDLEPTKLQNVERHVAELLGEIGVTAAFSLVPLRGGRNNRTFRVSTSSSSFLLKWYFSHQQDDRDRVSAEFAFCCCLWQHGIRQIPQPLGVDRSIGLGLFEFLPGRPPSAQEVTWAHHQEALAFIQDLNTARGEPSAIALANASEACFSLAEHVARIDGRLENLENVPVVDDVDRTMVKFVRQDLRTAFEQQRAALAENARRANLNVQEDLSPSERLLSPSDFGFHNTLLQEDGSLRFVDFEYAGWDDPAKLVSDFFCQIQVPAWASEFASFLDGVAQLSFMPEGIRQRTRILFPFYQIKWCCILLNEFLPTGGARRAFSDSGDATTMRADQLDLARSMLTRLDDARY